MTENNVLNIALKNSEYGCAGVRKTIDDFTELNHFPEEEVFRLQICLVEAIMNIVNHGFGDADEHDIDIQMEFNADTRVLVIRIEDDGTMFDSFSESSLHDFDSLLPSLSSGILAFYLLRKYADYVFYCRQSTRNHLVLSKTITRKPNGLAAGSIT